MKPAALAAGAEGRETAISPFCFYAYGRQGRTMYAIRAPFAAPASGEGLIGRRVRIEGKLGRGVSILRQIDGPIAAGDPIGVEVSAVDQDLPDGSFRAT